MVKLTVTLISTILIFEKLECVLQVWICNYEFTTQKHFFFYWLWHGISSYEIGINNGTDADIDNNSDKL